MVTITVQDRETLVQFVEYIVGLGILEGDL